MKKKLLKTPIFPVEFKLQVGTLKEVKDFHSWDDDVMGMCGSSGTTVFITIVKSKHSKHTYVNTIAHEVVHAVNRMYELIHDNPVRDNDEVQAYLSGWLAQELFNLYHKK